MTSHSPPTSASPFMAFSPHELTRATRLIRHPIHIIQEANNGRIGLTNHSTDGSTSPFNHHEFDHLATLPPLYPEWLGDRSFCEAHDLRFPYVGGAMANGIASPEMVIALAKAGMMGFLGTAGLSLDEMTEYIQRTRRTLGAESPGWGANLIHSPQEPTKEMATVELFFELGVRRISASAFMGLTPAIVRYAAKGLHRHQGQIRRRHHIFAKISRPEVAGHFMRPAPSKLLDELVHQGQLTAEEAQLARHVPVASDITVESDSGGHTDNRPLSALFPVIAKLRDTIVAEHDYPCPIRLGAAGGLGTPSAVAAAFSLGAAYVLTGSINQSSVEAAQSQRAKELLSQAAFSDVTMAPAGDMFEMGVEVQVLQRGVLFASRAKRLYEVYSHYESIDAIPNDLRNKLEDQIFRDSLEAIWQKTRDYFQTHDPEQVQRAHQDPKHKLALVCRWYLGLSSKWPLDGHADRAMDFQIWMGPAQGAFNDWVAGSFLESLSERGVVQMALNLIEGAAIITRAQQLRSYGAAIPSDAFNVRPRRLGL